MHQAHPSHLSDSLTQEGKAEGKMVIAEGRFWLFARMTERMTAGKE